MAKLSSGTLEAIRNFGKEGMLTGSGQRMAPVTPAQTFGGGAGSGIKKMLGAIMPGSDFKNPTEKYRDQLAGIANDAKIGTISSDEEQTQLLRLNLQHASLQGDRAAMAQATKAIQLHEANLGVKKEAKRQADMVPHKRTLYNILAKADDPYGQTTREEVGKYALDNNLGPTEIDLVYSAFEKSLGKDSDNLSTAAAGKDIFLDPETRKRYSLEIYRQEGKDSIAEYTEIGNPEAKVTDDIIKRLVTEKGEGQLTEDELRRQREWDTERDSYVANSNKALATIGDLKEAERVLAVVNTGGLDSQWESIKSFFGGGTPDKSRINVTFGQFVLERIKELGNNPTDTDLAFLKQMAPSLQAGTQTNLALIKDLLVRLNRVQRKGQWLLENPKSSKNDYLKFESELIKLDQLDQRNA
tara:strand:+ start:2162 stop:3400 length:1239 start_codon:yes stop_codon:yes gene_type:complete